MALSVGLTSSILESVSSIRRRHDTSPLRIRPERVSASMESMPPSFSRLNIFFAPFIMAPRSTTGGQPLGPEPAN